METLDMLLAQPDRLRSWLLTKPPEQILSEEGSCPAVVFLTEHEMIAADVDDTTAIALADGVEVSYVIDRWLKGFILEIDVLDIHRTRAHADKYQSWNTITAADALRVLDEVLKGSKHADGN